MKQEGAMEGANMPERCLDLQVAQPGDWPAVQDLLERAGLPLDGLDPGLRHFVVARDGARLVGVAGLEHYGRSALLRSVAVDAAWRSTGVGRLVVDGALDLAKSLGADDVYLLTTTAQEYFPKFGFRCVRRQELPAALGASAELRGACPDTAIAMRRDQPTPGGRGSAQPPQA